MPAQLPLGVGLTDGAAFDTFHTGPNEAAVQGAMAAATGREPVSFVHGGAGTGKSHLLHAACTAALEAGRSAALLPLGDRQALAPPVIDGWERFDLVCIDDLGEVAGDGDWERALFALYNALHENGGTWFASGRAAPAALGLALPDLASRVAAGPVYRLQALDDDGRLAALTLRARRRGLELPDDVGRFLLKRASRDMAALTRLLAELDRASLAQQRRLTIPLVKQVLGSE